MPSSSHHAEMPARTILCRPMFMLLIVLALSLLGAAPAHAVFMVVPGSQCQAAKADVSKIAHVNSFIQNESSTASAKIVCPLAFDFGAISSEAVALRIIVNAVDRNPITNVSCRALANDLDTGEVVWNGGSQSTTGTSEGGGPRWEISLQDDPHILGVYVVVCTLPLAPTPSQRSTLRSITVVHLLP